MADRLEATGPRTRGPIIATGIVYGLVAGAIFALAEMIVTAAMGMGWLAPWKAFASIILGQSAMMGGLDLGTFVVGFIVHFAISALLGAIWGVIASVVPRSVRLSHGAHGAAAAIFGLAVYAFNFQVIARSFYPWFLELNQVAQLFLHAFAFGLPLGLMMVSALKPLHRATAGRRVTV